jgi:hypothetical protein
LEKLAAYQENSAEAAMMPKAAKALPGVTQRQRASCRLGPQRYSAETASSRNSNMTA